ncbi:MAG: hypothetical protein K5649_08275 [Lachnospiraceae bacterium]|nr:hypothetical protein [Lachnospiraceae bacterium]
MTKMHFLLDEEASAGVILTELVEQAQNIDASAQWLLYEDFEDRALVPELSLKAQGIMGGMRLRIGTDAKAHKADERAHKTDAKAYRTDTKAYGEGSHVPAE